MPGGGDDYDGNSRGCKSSRKRQRKASNKMKDIPKIKVNRISTTAMSRQIKGRMKETRQRVSEKGGRVKGRGV